MRWKATQIRPRDSDTPLPMCDVASCLPEVPKRVRLLCPFDPVVRDRDRTQRLFDFYYRFEAFVPKAKRRHGYYVMPILEGDRLIGRLDPKLHRERGELEIRFIEFEKGVSLDRKRRASRSTKPCNVSPISSVRNGSHVRSGMRDR